MGGADSRAGCITGYQPRGMAAAVCQEVHKGLENSSCGGLSPKGDNPLQSLPLETGPCCTAWFITQAPQAFATYTSVTVLEEAGHRVIWVRALLAVFSI